MKMTNYHWIFVGGAVSLIGTIIVLYFTFKQNESSSKRNQRIEEKTTDIKFQNEELLKKNSELKGEVDELRLENLTLHRELQDEAKIINDNITGGNSYPFLYLKNQENPQISTFYIKIVGENSLRNLKFTSLNISNVERFHKSNPRDLIAERSRTIFVSQESILKYKDEKQKAYTSNTKLKDGDYHPKIDKFVGNQSFDFSESTNGVATAILIEASNGNYYHLFNWGLIFSYSKSPSYNSLIEEVLYDENGKILYENFSKHDWFFYPQYKLNKLKDISFENIKKYFDEKKKMTP